MAHVDATRAAIEQEQDATLESFLRRDPCFTEEAESDGSSPVVMSYPLQPLSLFWTCGVLALAFTGFPPPIDALKDRLNNAAQALRLAPENRGSRWAKTTIAAAATPFALTSAAARAVATLLATFTPEFARLAPIRVSCASLVWYHNRSLCDRRATLALPFCCRGVPTVLPGGDDANEREALLHSATAAVSDRSALLAAEVLAENFGPTVSDEALAACMAPNPVATANNTASSAAVYEAPADGLTIVLDLAPKGPTTEGHAVAHGRDAWGALCDVLHRVAVAYEELRVQWVSDGEPAGGPAPEAPSAPVLPVLTWFPKDVLHCTVRGVRDRGAVSR